MQAGIPCRNSSRRAPGPLTALQYRHLLSWQTRLHGAVLGPPGSDVVWMGLRASSTNKIVSELGRGRSVNSEEAVEGRNQTRKRSVGRVQCRRGGWDHHSSQPLRKGWPPSPNKIRWPVVLSPWSARACDQYGDISATSVDWGPLANTLGLISEAEKCRLQRPDSTFTSHSNAPKSGHRIFQEMIRNPGSFHLCTTFKPWPPSSPPKEKRIRKREWDVVAGPRTRFSGRASLTHKCWEVC